MRINPDWRNTVATLESVKAKHQDQPFCRDCGTAVSRMSKRCGDCALKANRMRWEANKSKYADRRRNKLLTVVTQFTDTPQLLLDALAVAGFSVVRTTKRQSPDQGEPT